MVTSNKAWVGSLPPFLPQHFLASPTPTSPTWWPALAVVSSGECVSPGRLRSPVSGLWPSQAVGSWLWPPRSAGLRAVVPGAAAAVAPQAGWLLGTARHGGGVPIDLYDLVTGVFAQGVVITCASWWMIVMWAFLFRTDQLSALYRQRVESRVLGRPRNASWAVPMGFE